MKYRYVSFLLIASISNSLMAPWWQDYATYTAPLWQYYTPQSLYYAASTAAIVTLTCINWRMNTKFNRLQTQLAQVPTKQEMQESIEKAPCNSAVQHYIQEMLQNKPPMQQPEELRQTVAALAKSIIPTAVKEHLASTNTVPATKQYATREFVESSIRLVENSIKKVTEEIHEENKATFTSILQRYGMSSLKTEITGTKADIQQFTNFSQQFSQSLLQLQRQWQEHSKELASIRQDILTLQRSMINRDKKTNINNFNKQ